MSGACSGVDWALVSCTSGIASLIYAYPEQLADAVIADWPAQAGQVPPRQRLIVVLSTCFQASLPREEVDIMNTLAEIHAGLADGLVGWRTYSQSSHPAITDLDEAVFEVGHLFAGLSAVDGALVLTQRLEVHGFGAEISSQLPPVDTVWRALDLEGTRVERDLAERFGTRHRSVFRLCQQYPEVIAIVISQDGHVRFVRHMNEHGVVYFDHRMLGA